MDQKSILQWNFRGLNANYNEILILTTLLAPIVICLQETFLKQTDISFKNYTIYNYITNANQKASGGTSVLIKSDIPHRPIDINSNLQAIVVNVTLSKPITICSIYLPPHDIFSKHDLENLINQLPRPFILLGDFKSHRGCSDTRDKGVIIENFIAENDLCLFNNKQATYLHSPTRKYFSLDPSYLLP